MSEEEERKLQIGVHVSEYQAVTSRSTYYAAIGSAVWPVIGAYLTVIATLWGRIAQIRYGVPVAVWASVVIVQCLVWYWAHWMHEQYMMVLYVERHLRPLVQKLVGTSCFWLFEPFLTKRRESGLYFAWEVKVPWAMAAALAAVTYVRAAALYRGHEPFALLIDLVGLFLNLILLRSLFRARNSIVAAHREWEGWHHSVIEQCFSNSQTAKQGQQT